MTETFALFAFQNIPTILETFALYALLIDVAKIVGGVVVVVAIWRGMRAHERIADSMERMAEATEKRNHQGDGEPRV
jgi:hypothetical protein